MDLFELIATDNLGLFGGLPKDDQGKKDDGPNLPHVPKPTTPTNPDGLRRRKIRRVKSDESFSAFTPKTHDLRRSAGNSADQTKKTTKEEKVDKTGGTKEPKKKGSSNVPNDTKRKKWPYFLLFGALVLGASASGLYKFRPEVFAKLNVFNRLRA